MPLVNSICNKCQHNFILLYWRRRKDIYYFLDNQECPKCNSDEIKFLNKVKQFKDLQTAFNYYAKRGEDTDMVLQKINNKEIIIFDENG